MSEIKRDAAADLTMCEAATPGPWEWDINEPHEKACGCLNQRISNGEYYEILYIKDGVVHCWTPDDKRFITESREAMPHWINRAVAAEAEAEKYRSMWFDLKEEIKQRMDASFDHFHVLQSLLGEMCIRESSFGK